ncbi:MAG: sugar phosphate isomerase/epimerase, partial [Clostridia bacterium]|nr:sugar phosphate isomerase/epimerase [Clostridia bacterium]
KYDAIISAFWCGWEGPAIWDFYDGQLTLGLVPPDFRQMRVKNLCDGADFAKKFGVTDVATHMGFIPENPNDPNFNTLCIGIRTVAKHLESNGQYLLFETGQETPVTMLRCFEKVGTDNLAINLDTANLILYGKANPVDALDVFGKYVRNMHAKDGFYPTNGHDLGRETRLGDGKVDFKALFAKLNELGFESYVTIEREIQGDKQIEDILYAKEYLEKIIADTYN